MKKKISCVVILYNPDMSVVENVSTYYQSMSSVYLWRNSKIDKIIEDKLNSLCGEKIVWCGNDENCGIGTALNQVLNDSKSACVDWLLTMDQDSAFCEGAIEEIIGYSSGCNNDIAIIAANHIVNGSPVHKTSDEQKWVMMSGNFVNVELALYCGGFDASLFIDGVDIEFCRRVLAKGYKIYVCTEASLSHNLGHSEDVSFAGYKTMTTNHSPVRLYYIFRNYLHINVRSEFSLGIRMLLYRFLIHKALCVILFEKNKVNKIKMMIKGIFHFAIGYLGIYKV